MKLREIEVREFRNLRHVVLSDMAKVNLLTGENGQGKTNLLEAIYFLLAGVSFRASDVREVFMEEGGGVSITGVVVMDSGIVRRIAVELRESGQSATKRLMVDGQRVDQQTLRSKFPVVVFSPEEVDQVRSQPLFRRRIVDMVAMVKTPRYKELLGEYVRIWRNRNQLLLAVKQQRALEEELDVWDEQLANVGAELVEIRSEVVAMISRAAKRYCSEFLPALGELRVAYLPNIATSSREEYRVRLREARRLDVVRAHTTRGIHRDDLGLYLGEVDGIERASRGEFRSIVLSLKLAVGEMLGADTGETPVYLLDDVISELDEARRAAITRAVADSQVVVTTHEEIPADRSWRVRGGVVTEGVRD